VLRDSIQKAFGGCDPRALRSHAGLWIDKMLAHPDPSSKEAAPHLRKLMASPIPEGYAEAFNLRRRDFELAADADEATVVSAKTTSRLVIGLGAKGVLEMGITLDHTWGLPFIPGSALKGLCAAAAHQIAEGSSWRKPEGWPEAAPPESRRGDALTDYELLFGTTANSGLVRFHDAWWEPVGNELPLAADVMTVHHSDYYQTQAGKPVPPPTDFDEPTPVPFLATRGTFVFALEGPAKWREVAFQLLEAALIHLGIGAKTSSGYGRMTLTLLESPVVKARRSAVEALGNTFRDYQAGQRTKGVTVLVDAFTRNIDLQTIAAAIRTLSKDLRKSLLEGVREKGVDAAKVDTLIALLTETPKAVPVAAAKTEPEKPKAPTTATRRVRFRKDAKDPKRGFIDIEGESKEYKAHALTYGEGVLDRLKSAGDWVEMTVTMDENKKPTIC
jgi:CRISPR-associated protein Cmr6